MIKRSLGWAGVVWILMAGSGWAQFKEGVAGQQEIKRGETVVQKWRCGVSITAAGGACTRLVATTPIPVDWPEQEVRVAEEDISPSARATYQMFDGVRQMTVMITQLPAGQEAHAIVTLEIRRSSILPPDTTDNLRLPDNTKLDKAVRPYLAMSPYIESRNPKIVTQAKKIVADQTNAWAKVEAMYDWVRENVKYEEGPIRGALSAMNNGVGDCEEMTALFIAFCRANEIPARTVHVPGHCYPEFYLVDDKNEGHWFPCQAAGARSFGGIPRLARFWKKGTISAIPAIPRNATTIFPRPSPAPAEDRR